MTGHKKGGGKKPAEWSGTTHRGGRDGGWRSYQDVGLPVSRTLKRESFSSKLHDSLGQHRLTYLVW